MDARSSDPENPITSWLADTMLIIDTHGAGRAAEAFLTSGNGNLNTSRAYFNQLRAFFEVL